MLSRSGESIKQLSVSIKRGVYNRLFVYICKKIEEALTRHTSEELITLKKPIVVTTTRTKKPWASRATATTVMPVVKPMQTTSTHIRDILRIMQPETNQMKQNSKTEAR